MNSDDGKNNYFCNEPVKTGIKSMLFSMKSMYVLLWVIASSSQLVSATTMIPNPGGSGQVQAYNYVNQFKPHGFTKKLYKLFYRMVPVYTAGPAPIYPNQPTPVTYFPEFLIEFDEGVEPEKEYEILKDSRFVHADSGNKNKEYLHLYLTTNLVYTQEYKAMFRNYNVFPPSWKPLNGKVLWGDLNGDFISDIIFYPDARNINHPTAYFPSFSVKLDEVYALTKYGPILQSRTPVVMQKIKKDVVMGYLSTFASVRLRDLNGDGRDELIVKQFANEGAATRIATPNTAGVLAHTTVPMGNNSASNTNDCGIQLKNMVYGTDYFTNDTCDRLYFLPPSEGKLLGSEITLSNNVNMCPNVKTTLDAEQEANAEITELTTELFSLIQQQFETPEYYSLLAIKNHAEDDVLELAHDLAIAENNLQYAQEILMLTEDDYLFGFADEYDVTIAENSVREAEEARESASFEHAVGVSTFESAEQNLAQYIQWQADRQNVITQALDSLYELNEQRRLLVGNLYQLYGGELKFWMSTNWFGLIYGARQNNKNVNVDKWMMMPITSGRVVSALPRDVSEDSGILWTRLIDLENQSTFHSDDRYGPFRAADVDNIEIMPILEEEVSFPGQSSYAAAMGLSLAALCEYYPGGVSHPMPPAVADLPKSLGLNLRNNYQYKTESGVRIAYNLGEVAKRIFAHFYRQSNPSDQYRHAFYRHHFFHRQPSQNFSGYFHVDKDELANVIHQLNESMWFTLRFVDPNITLANQEVIRESVKKQLIDNIFTAVTLEHADISSTKRNLSSAILLNPSQLFKFVQRNSRWINADAERGVYISGSRYTNYQ